MLTFDADFESANLDQVRVRPNNTFDCFMRNDTNGNGNLQWFYFRMKNTSEFMETVKINIVNFTKGNSLFHHVSIKNRGDVIFVDSYHYALSIGHETIDLVYENE